MTIFWRLCKRWKLGIVIPPVLTVLAFLIVTSGDQRNAMMAIGDDAGNTHSHTGHSRFKARRRTDHVLLPLVSDTGRNARPLDKPPSHQESEISGSSSIDQDSKVTPNASNVIVNNRTHILLEELGGIQKITVHNLTDFNPESQGETERKPRVPEKALSVDSSERTNLSDNNPGPPLQLNIHTQAQDNVSTDEHPVDYSDCASAKVKRPYTYPEYTAIVSAHGSGNTWARYLIERATGVSTGSYYQDPKLYKGGFLGEMTNPLLRNTIAIKTHHPFQRNDINFTNAIVIVRDPFDVAIAERNRVKSRNGHVSVVSDSHFRGPDWEKFARGHSWYWEHSCRECLTIPNHLIVYYSDLKTHLERELRRMLKFLKVAPDEKRIACILAYPNGQFKREKKERKFNPYSRELTEEINGHIRNVTALFESLDVAPLPFGEREYEVFLMGENS